MRPAGAEALKRGLVAYVPQSEEVDWNFPVLVEDVVMMGRYGHMNFLRMPSRADRDKVDEALARVGMVEFRKRQIGELSPAGRRSASFWRERWRRAGASSCSTSRSPAST